MPTHERGISFILYHPAPAPRHQHLAIALPVVTGTYSSASRHPIPKSMLLVEQDSKNRLGVICGSSANRVHLPSAAGEVSASCLRLDTRM